MSGEGEQVENGAAAAESAAVSVPGEARAPRRTMSARQIAERTGRGKRIVLLWATRDGCPHTPGMSRGKPSPRFNLEEVKAWLRAKGLPEVVSKGKGKGGGKDGGKGGDDDDPSMFEMDFSERLAQASETVDLRLQIKRLNAQLNALMEKRPPASAQSDWARKWAEAVNGVSKELRQLEVSAFEADQRKGVWIQRAVADDVATAAARMFTDSLLAYTNELPELAVAAVMDLIPPARVDEARRLIAAEVRKLSERSRKSVADGIAARVPTGAAA